MLLIPSCSLTFELTYYVIITCIIKAIMGLSKLALYESKNNYCNNLAVEYRNSSGIENDNIINGHPHNSA